MRSRRGADLPNPASPETSLPPQLPAGRFRPGRDRLDCRYRSAFARCWGMCVLTLAWDIHPDWPLVAAGNRDEEYARLSEPLVLRRVVHLTDTAKVVWSDGTRRAVVMRGDRHSAHGFQAPQSLGSRKSAHLSNSPPEYG
ncbi:MULTISPECIES: NRDE family protein [unclassified Brevundimonas]|uniref:NRDE family protein n=2 Tax=Brevundimonas TaxID=41275 RepID=UPI0034CD951D